MSTSIDTLRAELGALLDELRDTQATIRALSTRVLLDPTAEEQAEPDRRTHLQRRRELLAKIGNVILRAVDAGAALELHAIPDLLAAATSSEPPTTPPVSAIETPPVDKRMQALGDATVHAVAEVPTNGVVQGPISDAHLQPLPAVVQPDPARLQAALIPSWARKPSVEEPPERAVDVPLLAGILTRLGPPPADSAEETLAQEVEVLSAEILSPRLAEWPHLPKPLQRHLVAMAAARARHVQIMLPSMAQPVARIFSALTRYSSTEKPGFVVGLQRDHDPRGATWVEDGQEAHNALRAELPFEMAQPKATPEKALVLLRAAIRDGATPELVADAVALALDAGVAPEDVRLLDLLEPCADALASVLAARARFKRLRRALRERLTGDEDDDDETSESDLPTDWAWWPATVDKRAVIIGGDLREEARVRIERAFRFSSLTWVTTDTVRGPQQLAQSIGAGSVDLVIILARFISHAIQEQVVPACKAAGVAWVVVDRGYGVSSVKGAIERFLAVAD